MARNLRKFLVPSLGVAAVAGLALAACQSYEFEEVAPKAFGSVNEDIVITGKMLPPYMMLVVDKSGSMDDPAFSGSTTTKWADLLGAFTDPSTGVLPKSREIARFGLTLYPSVEGGCGVGSITVPLDPERHNVDIVMQQLNAVAPLGGTPTAMSLETAAKDPALVNEEPGRLRFVMLLTDGLPNCNPSPENQARCDACNANHAVCRDVSQNGCAPTYGSNPDYPCDLGMDEAPKGSDCLDENGTVEAVAKLRQSGIDTFVIGFGDAFGGDGHRVLNGAAEAGGRAREDPETKYFKASNKEELAEAVRQIIDETQGCNFPVDPAPTSENVFQVTLFDGQEQQETALVRGEEWKFSSSSLNNVEVLGARCDLLQNATPNRYSIRFRYAASL